MSSADHLRTTRKLLRKVVVQAGLIGLWVGLVTWTWWAGLLTFVGFWILGLSLHAVESGLGRGTGRRDG